MKNSALGDLVMVKYLVFRGTHKPYVSRESIKCLHVQLRLTEVLAGSWRPCSAASPVVATSTAQAHGVVVTSSWMVADTTGSRFSGFTSSDARVTPREGSEQRAAKGCVV
ncbi:hypothetical protein E2C01_004442 [Portunus trituberculatus]|uniref:Uncharacterized protein n=1 Tax=Portunus trituberculatus TaxID=210409 RepID=A0A5B7CPU2_PORTR|nr:hypothetical protein [Portunus trituberculatus]